MKRLLPCLIFVIATLASCITEDVPDNTITGNFESLWKTIDEHYCFFEEKNNLYNVDWNEVHARYKAQLSSSMTNDQLFQLCGKMLAELRDGHVNLTASHDMARYWKWFEDYPANYSDSIERIYLKTDYYLTCGIKYRILSENIGYIRVSTFENSIGSGNLSEIFRTLALCSGVIVDVRSNSGGMLSSAEKLASGFVNTKTLAGYIRHKTGKGHSDFSDMKAVYVTPTNGVRWQKPVVVLTNRNTYSAANTFVMYMKDIANATIVGDKTGGGGGMPFNSEMPNGWSIRFSACPMYDTKKQCVEDGIEPDKKVNITSDDYQRGVDTIIEAAIKILRTK